MIKINLIGEGRRPAAVRKRRDISLNVNRENLGNYLLLVGLLVGLLALAGEWWYLRSDLAGKTAQIVDLEEEYRILKPIIDKVNRFKKKKSDLERKIEVIENLKLNQKGPVVVMDNVSRAVPERVWLRRMEIQAKVIKLSGQASNENVVATFIDNLDRYEEFSEPVLRHMRETGGGFYNFDIDVGYDLNPTKPADAAAAGG